MGEHRISEYLLSIAKKAKKSIDTDKMENIRQKMVKKSTPFLVIGGIIVAIGFILIFTLMPKLGPDMTEIIAMPVVMVGAIILAIGVFFYRTSKQLYFGADLIDSLNGEGRKCPKCGEACGDKADFCEKCGAKLLRAKICNDCHTQNEDDAEFCVNCGKKLNYKINCNNTNIFGNYL